MNHDTQQTKITVGSQDEQVLYTITIIHKPDTDPMERLRNEIGEWLNTDTGNEAWQYSLVEFNWGDFMDLASKLVEWSEWLLSYSVESQKTNLVNFNEHLVPSSLIQ